MERLSPNSVQTLEIKIRRALLRNDDIEAEKLIKLGYQVINKGIWSKNCYKKLYILGKRPGSSSMHKPSKDNYDLYNLKDKNFLEGLNVYKGHVTYKAVADVFGHEYVSPREALTNV